MLSILTVLCSQVGGHKRSEGVKGMLLAEPNYILKPLQSRSRGEFEVAFYEEIEVRGSLCFFGTVSFLYYFLLVAIFQFLKSSGSDIGRLYGLDQFLSTYHGCVHVDPNEEEMIGGKYMVFENITARYKHPCVIDIKLGKRTYVSHATEEKKLKECLKYPWQEEAGFRFVGSRTYDTNKGYFKSTDKKVCRKVTPDKFLEFFAEFFSSGIAQVVVRRVAIQSALSLLTRIIQAFRRQEHFVFTSSSLLIAYDAHVENEKSEVDVDLKFIDVAHVSGGEVGVLDESTLFGLERVADYLRQLLASL